MDFKSAARQEYSGGIIFTSYVIAVLGAMTTLELLTKRTHISGFYNWFLLSAAAASMGGVGIWCMHFIGNNSLTITLANGEVRALYYSPGFTFLSLIVAIITMFLAFVFVGITEEAKVVRIVPSGVIAGLGIVSMHYLGQVAVDFFILKNKTSYVVCAVIIAVCAVTAALFIFFKLREQWANQWYKRLGCAMLMGLAVCGMHYTAMVGTEYYPGRTNGEQPSSVLKTPVIIGVATAIVVSTCVLFFAIGVKHEFLNTLFCKGRRDQYKHIILDVVFFDTNGRILVNIDGLVPMKEIWSEEQDNDGFIRDFTPNHPLFAALLKITIGWIKLDDDANDPVISYSRQKNYSEFEARFLDAANQLVEDLHLSELSDLGYLFDSVIRTNTIVEKHHGLFSKIALEGIQKKARRVSQPAAWLLSKKPSGDLELAMDEPTQPDQTRSKSASGQDTLAICKFNTGNDSKTDCVPFNIYQSMACYMTHIAAERYRSEQSGQILQQRRIYEQPSSSSIQPHMKHIKNMTGLSTKSDNASDKAKETIPQIMASLPPPPRVKYNKNNTSVDINYMLKHPPPSSPIPPTPIELQDIITILSTKQRFAWLHDLYKELLKEDL
ncbi:hypothetical protein CU097_007174 [Rhizopus azygosporus]|uniref:MHYT domain-containing protein n=1 Tax=Rhizopus azygosporus TaxID=86630 RepID=A0A367K8C1_RHIAZ|nr:hypothetical protein CU097_007174 [Rhizopus azygosporus]